MANVPIGLRGSMQMYQIEVEIFEGKGGQLRREGDRVVYPDLEKEGICAWMYRGDGEHSYEAGQRFSYPEDFGRLCPWLVDSLHGVIHALRSGGTLRWRYEGTPYEKEIDPTGVTTEFIRCIDPTASGIVVKVIRTRLT
jgi:uncharacterized repeat protein (TIGR04076 family)